MKIRPLYDRIVVRRKEQTNVTNGGLYIPSNNNEKPSEGEVLAVGTGRLLHDGSLKPLEVKAGDRIMFGKYSGTEMNVDGEEYLIIREDDILAVF